MFRQESRLGLPVNVGCVAAPNCQTCYEDNQHYTGPKHSKLYSLHIVSVYSASSDNISCWGWNSQSRIN